MPECRKKPYPAWRAPVRLSAHQRRHDHWIVECVLALKHHGHLSLSPLH